LPGGDRFAPLDLSPQRKKERTFAAMLRQLEELSVQQPVLMIFEDLHWIDPSSREFLDLILARIDHLPVLLVATFRPEFQPPWTGQPHVTMIAAGLIRAASTISCSFVKLIFDKPIVLHWPSSTKHSNACHVSTNVTPGS
jgi:hypothetical protein